MVGDNMDGEFFVDIKYMIEQQEIERAKLKEVKEVDYNDYEDRNITFLFETEKWNGDKVSKMDSSHIINTLLMLERKSNRYKTNYELFVIDHSNDTMLVPKDNINDLVKMDSRDWIKTTPIYKALYAELESRNLTEYFETIKFRFATQEEAK